MGGYSDRFSFGDGVDCLCHGPRSSLIMLGLKRGTVVLCEHDEKWDQEAKQIIAVLKEVLDKEAVETEHIGSTAIASIKAKPIIDLLVGVKDIDAVLL